MKFIDIPAPFVLPMLVGFGLSGCGGNGSPSDLDAGPSGEVADAAALRDGAVVQCQADHQESLEARNDRIINEANQVEPTGQVLSRQGGFTVCGQLDPAQQRDGFTDVDVYEFAVSGEQSVRIELTLESPGDLENVEFLLLGADGPSTLAQARMTGDYGLAHRIVPDGVYWVAVLAKSALAEGALPYRISVSPTPVDCEPPAATEDDYPESLDTQSHRGNDTLRIDYEQSGTFLETPDENDAPEPTEITLGAGSRLNITGVTANVEALDDYRDRDTFLIHTGPETRELAVRLSWLDDVGVDLDLHVFEAGTPGLDRSFASAATVGAGQSELATMAVFPDQDYWIWIGAYAGAEPDLPQDYQLTLCGASL